MPSERMGSIAFEELKGRPGWAERSGPAKHTAGKPKGHEFLGK